jgi:hypothetical protein
MAEFQPSKLAMRVRFPSPALLRVASKDDGAKRNQTFTTTMALCDGAKPGDPLKDASIPMPSSMMPLNGTKTLVGPDQATPPIGLALMSNPTPVGLVVNDHSISTVFDVVVVVHVARTAALFDTTRLKDS